MSSRAVERRIITSVLTRPIPIRRSRWLPCCWFSRLRLPRLPSQDRDHGVAPPPGTAVTNPALREAELQKRIAASPRGVAAYRELAKLQEDRGALAEAERTLMQARQAVPDSKDAVLAARRVLQPAGRLSEDDRDA